MSKLPQLIKTERLMLRPYTAADAPYVVACLNNFDVSRWLSSVPHPFTADDLRLFTLKGESRWPNMAAITLSGEFIGALGTGGGLGYWLKPEFWGRGIISEAAAALVDFYFENTSEEQLKAGHFIGNAASARVLAKLGFVEVARDTQPCAAQGRDLPHVALVLTRQTWKAA